MTAPDSPPSSGLFLSSSPIHYGTGPDEEVERIVREAQRIDSIEPSIESILRRHSEAFVDTLERQVQLIKSRSQDFRDCQITVFDKALLVLTRNGGELHHASAVTFFCKEFLGVSSNANLLQKQFALLAVSLTPAQVSTPPETQRGSISTQGTRSASPGKKQIFKKNMDEQKSARLSALAVQIDSATSRLWMVYQKAKDDFDTIDDPSSLEKQRAAKFLRDTAENTLFHLNNKDCDQRLLDELRITLAVAKQTAMTLHGGKKRKFDDPVSSVGDERTQSQVRRPPSVDIERANARVGKRARSTNEPDSRGIFAGHSRALAYHSQPRKYENVRNGQSFMAPEISPKGTRAPKRSKSHQPGRGHSGIPFGYSRPVDSYQP